MSRILSVILPNGIAQRIFPGTHRTSYVPSLPCLRLLLTVWAALVSIDTLPDELLLRIFDFDRVIYLDGLAAPDRLWRPSLYWGWHRLVHVCRRWRSVVFKSPTFLDLKLVCGPHTLVQFTRLWPPLPIILRGNYDGLLPGDYDFDAAIVHPNRVCEINLQLTRPQLRRLVSVMQEQFPALIHLTLGFLYNDGGPTWALSGGFLGGSAPLLQSLELDYIPFPALPKLLLSTNSLVRLTLKNIPHSGYISAKVIVTGLGALANLKYLIINFKSPTSCPNRGSPSLPPPTRITLPTLTRFEFKGTSEYLEDFVARVDAPLLDSIYITFFHQLIFELPQLVRFTRRTTMFQELKEAHVDFDNNVVHVETLPPIRTFDEKSGLEISCKELDWQLSSLEQVFAPFFPSIHMVEHLYIYGSRNLPTQRLYDIENMQWLELFDPFIAAKNLYLSKKFAPLIAPALQELVGGRTAEVLPTLQNIYLEGPWLSEPIQEGIQKFVVARQDAGHPVTIFLWERF